MELSEATKLDLQRAVYTETQNWARHNETLLVAVNTVILGAWGSLYAQSFQEGAHGDFFVSLTAGAALLGLLVTWRLNGQYKRAIHRLVVYERYFGLHQCDAAVQRVMDPSERQAWGCGFVPLYLHGLPRPHERSAWIFYLAHFLLLAFALFKVQWPWA